MYKTKEEIEKEFYNKFSFIQAIKNEKSGNAYTRVIDFIHQIRQDDLEAIKDIVVRELGYLNIKKEEERSKYYLQSFKNIIEELEKLNNLNK